MEWEKVSTIFEVRNYAIIPVRILKASYSIHLLFFLLIFKGIAFAQIDIYPSHLNQVPYSKGIYNPALQNSKGLIDITSANQAYVGKLDDVRNIFLLASISLQGSDTTIMHQRLGLKFVNELEGEFISSPKWYINYLWSRQIFKSLRLTASANIGRANITYHATSVSGTYTAGGWDGGIGLAFSGKKYTAAIGLDQIFNSIITPLNYSLKWKRYPNFYLERNFQLSQSAQIDIYFHASLLTTYPNRYDAGIQLLLSQKVNISINYYLNNAVAFNLGLQNLSWNKHHVSLLLTYSFPFSNQVKINIQSFELGLHYNLKKR